MKDHYPDYPQGTLKKIEEGLSTKNKKILYDFLKQISINAGKDKTDKIRRQLLQLKDIIEKDYDKFTKDDIDSFLIVLNNDKRSFWTKNEIKCCLKRFLKWFYKDIEMMENIKYTTTKMDSQKINDSTLIDEKEIEKMLRHAESYKEKAYLFLLFETGARPQELQTLKWKDIKFEDNFADITLFSSKTQRSRVFPVKRARDLLFEWKQHYSYPDVSSNDYVFVSNKKRDKMMTNDSLNKMLQRMCKKAGLNKNIWNYLMRHTRATRLYEELPQQIVEKLMGHTNMAGIYAHISNKKAREVMLEKIYKVEKLTKGDKQEIKKLKEEMNEIKKSLMVQGVTTHLFQKYHLAKISKEEFLSEMKELHKEAVKLGVIKI